MYYISQLMQKRFLKLFLNIISKIIILHTHKFCTFLHLSIVSFIQEYETLLNFSKKFYSLINTSNDRLYENTIIHVSGFGFIK